MANSFDANLVLDRVTKRTITYLGNVFAPLAAFSTDFGSEEYTQGQNVRFQVANAGPTVQTNPTNWESGDFGLTNVNLLVNQYSASIGLTPRQLNNEFRLDQATDIALQNLGNKIIDVAFTPVTTTNFSNVTVAQTSLVVANLRTAWAGIAKSQQKNLILDATSYSQFLPGTLTNDVGLRPGFAGFDATYLNTRWTGAGTNIYGFACGSGSLAVLAGLPKEVPAGFEGVQQQVVTVPLGGRGTLNQGPEAPSLQLLQSMWIAPATRTMWISYDLMFGAAAVGDTASGYVFKSA